jgi:glucose/arabinose dehydrogenase
MNRRLALCLAALIVCALVAPLAPRRAYATLPSEFDKTIIAHGLDDPTSFRFAPNGDIYIGEQAGAIKVFRNGSVITLGSVSAVNDHEKGLLGIELDKNFATNHYLYASYTNVDGYARLSRFTVVNDTLDMASEFVFYKSDQPASIYHNADDMISDPTARSGGRSATTSRQGTHSR